MTTHDDGSRMGAAITTRRADLGVVDLAYLSAGEPGAPLAICLHGFPDSASTWRHLLPRLADAGYHAVAPYLRGYAPSGLASDGAYQTGAVAADAIALHDHLGGGPAVIIGHDWGALGTYGAAVGEPERWARVVTLAVPPGPVVAEAFFRYDQLRLSWYMFFFQNPLAEMTVMNEDWAFIRSLWRDWSPGYDGTADVDDFIACCSDAPNLSAALAYYRSMIGGVGLVDTYETLQAASLAAPPQPVLYLHGANDGCMMSQLGAQAADHLVDGSEVLIVEGTGHFLHLEKPGLVNDTILQFIAPT